MAKNYILHRNRNEIEIQKEPEVFTAVLPNKRVIEEVSNISEISQVEQVFSNVFKIRTSESDVDGYLDHLRHNFETRCVFHHSYNPTGDLSTRYYITDLVAVNFREKTSNAKIESILQKHGLQFLKKYPGDGLT